MNHQTMKRLVEHFPQKKHLIGLLKKFFKNSIMVRFFNLYP